jgi:hypothetical protein
MKPLEKRTKTNYYGHIVTVFGYWKHGIIVQGWDSFGPVAQFCKNMKEAKELIKEEEYEDSYARLIAKPGKMFVELDTEEIYNKMIKRRELHKSQPKPECKGILYGWDGSALDWSYGSFEEFDKFEIVYGQRLVWFNGKDMYERYLEYDFEKEIMYGVTKINHKNLFDILNEGLEDVPDISEPKFDFGL